MKFNYVIIFEDNKVSPKATASSTNKLINMDKVSAVFSMWNLTSNVASSIAEKEGVFSFSCAYGEKSTEGEYSFNMHANFLDEAIILAKELNKRNIKKVAMFIDNSAMTEQYAVLEDYLSKNTDIEIVYKDYFNPGEKDYRMAIAKASQKGPDLYLISGYPPSPYLFIKQMKEVTGRNDNISSIDAIAEINPKDLSIANGLWFVDSNQNGLADFQQELYKRTGVEALGCSGNLAASLEIFISAIESNYTDEKQELNKDQIRDWIFDNVKDFPTYSGDATVINNGLIIVPPSIKIVKDGKVVEE